MLRSPTAPSLSRLITKRALAKPLGFLNVNLATLPLRNVSVIDATLLDGFAYKLTPSGLGTTWTGNGGALE